METKKNTTQNALNEQSTDLRPDENKLSDAELDKVTGGRFMENAEKSMEKIMEASSHGSRG